MPKPNDSPPSPRCPKCRRESLTYDELCPDCTRDAAYAACRALLEGRTEDAERLARVAIERRESCPT